MILIVILVFAGFTVQSIHNKSIRKNELDTNLSAAIEESLSVLAIDPDYSAEGEEELLSDAIENLLTRITSDSDFKVRVLAADAEKGILDIEATEHFRQPGGKEASVTWSYESPMPEDYTVDTWPSQLAEEDSPVTHTVTFEVRDSAGNAVTATRQVIVKYDNYPEIQAEDRYFSLDEARNGLITEAELRSCLTASDIEDGDLTDQIELLNFNADEFKSFTDKGYVVIKTKVKDSMFNVRLSGINAPSGVKNVEFPTWTDQGGQDDIVWYTGVKQSDGSYLAKVDLGEHNFESGTYNIHCYVWTSNGVANRVGATSNDYSMGTKASMSYHGFDPESDYGRTGYSGRHAYDCVRAGLLRPCSRGGGGVAAEA